MDPYGEKEWWEWRHKEHDEDAENVEMKSDKDGTYYRKWTSLESGRLEEEN